MKEFFDLLIAIVLLTTALPAVFLLYHFYNKKSSWEKQNPRSTKISAGILIFIFCLTIYGSFIEPKILVVNNYQVDLPEISQPIKIAFVADFQVGKYKQAAWVEKTVEKIIELKPDLVFLGGDLVDNESYESAELAYLEPLKKLARLYPTYAVPGNHEYGVSCSKGIAEECDYSGDVSLEVKQKIISLGIKYLMNNLEKITINNSSFYLFGGDEYWAKKLDFIILNTRTENIPTIALIHNPAFILGSYPKFDLILSGHTHGGQIRLPFFGPVGRVDNLLPTKYYKGLQTLPNNGPILITSGVGETGVRARLFNPPEIIFLTIE